MLTRQEKNAFELAIEAAKNSLGCTMPNPAVGAAALCVTGEVLGVAATERAGKRHAERKLIEELIAKGLHQKIHTLLVTLEPCNHSGRTPPCTEMIISTSVKRVVYGVSDPNLKVAGGGAEFLRTRGIEVLKLDDETIGEGESPVGESESIIGEYESLVQECELLIRAFRKHITTGLPYVLMKTAHQFDGSMIPPDGAKTFTSAESLKLAHVLRKESDAILTGAGTVIADLPEFTIRHVSDSREIPRWIVVMDREGKTPREWISGREKAGFKVKTFSELSEALKFLGDEGCLQVLVEAGPTLVHALDEVKLWDEWMRIEVQGNGKPDLLQYKFK